MERREEEKERYGETEIQYGAPRLRLWASPTPLTSSALSAAVDVDIESCAGWQLW